MEKINPTVGFITFEKYYGRSDIGSSRIRANWLCNYWPEAEVAVMGKKYDVVVFQKSYWPEYAELFDGVKILDICDADFKHWGYRIKQLTESVDAVVTSTMELAKYMVKLTDKPVWCIPDRIDFATLGGKVKNHKGNGPTKTVAWYGYAENYPMLEASILALVELKVQNLIVIASKGNPFMLPPSVADKINLINYPWTAGTANDDLLRADVVINPRLDSGRWKYKSNNKTILAWALGLPVAHTKAELAELMTEEQRIAEVDKRRAEVLAEFDVKKSVEEYKALITDIYATRQG